MTAAPPHTEQAAARRFRRPTVDEVAAYIAAQGYAFSAAAFCAYYDSAGWTVGRNKPMRDWRAACRTWQLRQMEQQQHAAAPRAADPKSTTHFAGEDRNVYDEIYRREHPAWDGTHETLPPHLRSTAPTPLSTAPPAIVNTRDRRPPHAYEAMPLRQLLPLHFALDRPSEVFWELMNAHLDGAAQWVSGYDDVVDYLADNHGKGLLLIGGTGVGKSIIATEVLPTIIHALYNRNLHIHRGNALADRNVMLKEQDYPFPVLDDIGTEAEVNDYGTRQYALCSIVANAENGGNYLVATTNLTRDAITARYGARTADRLFAHCRVITLNSPNLRR